MVGQDFRLEGASRLHVVDCRLHTNGEVQLRADGWSTTRLQRTMLVSQTGPAWTRQLSSLGYGAKLLIDGTRRMESQGFSTPEDLKTLLATKQEKPQATAPSTPRVPAVVSRQPSADDEATVIPLTTQAESNSSPKNAGVDASNPFLDDDEQASTSVDTAPSQATEEDLGDPFLDDQDEGDASLDDLFGGEGESDDANEDLFGS